MATENESENEKGIGTKELEEFFRNRFVTCDNLSRNVAGENICIMRERGALLALAALTTGRLAPFLKWWSQQDGVWHLNHTEFPTKCSIPCGTKSCEFSSGRFSFKTGRPADPIFKQKSYDVLYKAFQPDSEDIECNFDGHISQIKKDQPFIPSNGANEIPYNEIKNKLNPPSAAVPCLISSRNSHLTTLRKKPAAISEPTGVHMASRKRRQRKFVLIKSPYLLMENPLMPALINMNSVATREVSSGRSQVALRRTSLYRALALF